MSKNYNVRSFVTITNTEQTESELVNFADLHDTFNFDFELSGKKEISFTLTYCSGFERVFNMAKVKAFVNYDNESYIIEQVEPVINENGLLQNKITASHQVFDNLKNLRYDSNPEATSGTNTNNDVSESTSNGITTKRTGEKKTYDLKDQLEVFFTGVDRNSLNYELHGEFSKKACPLSDGTVLEWLNSNLATYSGTYLVQGHTLHIYTYEALKHVIDLDFRYLYNVSKSTIQSDVNNLVNVRKVYAGKMEDTYSSDSSAPGVTTSQNGDWSEAVKNAAALMNVSIDSNGVSLVLAQIKLESGGNEKAIGGNDGLSDGNAKGLLQFKQATFDKYAVDGHKDIMNGFDQLLAFFNIPNVLAQINGHTGWSPTGERRSKTIIKQPSRAQEVIDYAKQNVGLPYAWGGPRGVDQVVSTDCSGLTSNIYKHFGITIGTVTYSQCHDGNRIDRSQVQTGDLGFYDPGPHHVVMALNNQQAIQQPQPGESCNVFDINSYPPSYWIRNDQMAALVGGGSGDTGSTSSSSRTYYAIKFEYRDEDSIKQYHVHVGEPLKLDAIYDEKEAREEAARETQSQPVVSLDLEVDSSKLQSIIQDRLDKTDELVSIKLGDQVHAIIPEQNINTDVMITKISGNDVWFNPNASLKYAFNNNNNALKDVNAALFQDIHEIRHNVNDVSNWLGNNMTLTSTNRSWIEQYRKSTETK